MRELFENTPSENATEAARRGARPAMRRRFYVSATVSPVAEGYAVQLDDKPVRTPARRLLAAPSLALAQAIAAEWDAQARHHRSGKNAADAAGQRDHRRRRRSASPGRGGDRNISRVGPAVLSRWRSPRLGRTASASLGPDPGLGARSTRRPIQARPRRHPCRSTGCGACGSESAIPSDPWRLGALHVVTTLTGSALLALAVLRGRLSVEDAWLAAHVDEDWNMERWGRDDMALERRAFRYAEFQAAAKVLRM